MKNSDITGIILAGGKASRLGGIDKCLLPVGGIPCIETIVSELKTVTGSVMIVANNNAYDYLGCKVVADIHKEIGPVGGVYSALYHTETEANFIVAGDMPHVNAELFRFILENTEERPASIPLMDGKTQPLCGYYSKKMLPLFQLLIHKNTLKMHDVIELCRFQKISITPEQAFYSERLFSNINTYNDYWNELSNQPKDGNKSEIVRAAC